MKPILPLNHTFIITLGQRHFMQYAISSEVRSFNRLRRNVRLSKGCNRSQGARSQIHPQSWLRRLSPHKCTGSSEVYLQAALTELEEPHQRPDPRIECPGSDPGRKVSSRNIRKDLRSQPLLTPQLLDYLLRWRSPLQSTSRSSYRSRRNPHPNQVYLRARERT